MTYPTIVLSLFSLISLLSIELPILKSIPILGYFITYLSILIFIIIGLIDKEFQYTPGFIKKIIITYWLYSIFIIVYGLIFSETYWNYKNVFISYIPSVFVSFAIFIGLKLDRNLNLLEFIIKRIFPIILIYGIIGYFLFSDTKYYHNVARLGVPIFFFILAIPFLQKKNQIFVIMISIFFIIIDLNWRTNILRVFFCYSFVILYFLFSLKKKFLNFIGVLVFSMPMILLYLGYSGKFDVFEYIVADQESESILAGNSRTFLYVEVFESLKNKNTNLLIGGGASAGYETSVFFDDKVTLSVDRERYKAEVAFLNTLNKSGLIGILLDILLIFISAYYVINRSNNDFSKLLSVYLFLSWILYFLEMPQSLNINYFMHYLIIGLCLSSSFRNSNNEEIKLLFNKL